MVNCKPIKLEKTLGFLRKIRQFFALRKGNRPKGPSKNQGGYTELVGKTWES